MIKVKRTGAFIRALKELGDQDLDFVDLTEAKILLFRKNPKDTRLRDHALRRKLKGKFAFSITDDIRIVYEWQDKTVVRFLAIGKHTKVYKRANR